MHQRWFLSALGVVVLTLPLRAQEWAQWRGPSRDGVVSAANAPAPWPASYTQTWRVAVGEGYSSPVIAGGRVFTHSRTDPAEIVTAIDLATGKVAWQQRYDAGFTKNQYATAMAKGPHATPLVAAGRVFTLGVTGVLTAWDAAAGRQLWRHDYSSEVDTSKLFCGTAASPLMAGGLLIVQVGSDTKSGKILGLDPATGVARWTWAGLGPGYGSPVIIQPQGIGQLAAVTEGSIVGIDFATGKQLWSTPFPDDWHENIVTPVWTGSALVVSGPRQGTHALAIEKNGTAWRVTETWKNDAVTMYMSTPVAGDGMLYGFSDKQKGRFVALDLKTGAVKWTTDGRQGEHASMLLTPSHLVALNNNGEMQVVSRSAGRFVAEKTYTVANSATWAMPVLLGRDLIVRDATGVMRLTGK
jgi:outer membrane protein assembly factor BamB